MVVIRLSRAGAKKRPFYHMVVTDSRRRRDSNYVEEVGYFNPIARGQEPRLHLDLEKITYWEGVGAQFSDRVKTLVKEYRKTAAPVAEVVKKPVKKTAEKSAKAATAEPEKKAAKKSVKKETAKPAKKPVTKAAE